MLHQSKGMDPYVFNEWGPVTQSRLLAYYTACSTACSFLMLVIVPSTRYGLDLSYLLNKVIILPIAFQQGWHHFTAKSPSTSGKGHKLTTESWRYRLCIY